MSRGPDLKGEVQGVLFDVTGRECGVAFVNPADRGDLMVRLGERF
jgi:hypothetical protein